MGDLKDMVKVGGDLIGTGFRLMIGFIVFAVAAVLVIVGLVVYLVFFSGTDTKTPDAAPVAIQSTAPQPAPIEIQYPIVTGLCFSTPMGDVGKVMSQDKDMLDMSFRGGVRSTYQFNQVTQANCAVLPPG
jgi:hypothetical protein